MYFYLIEANRDRINEIPYYNGNLIVNIDDGEMQYDTKELGRIRLSGVSFYNTEEDLFKTTGHQDRLYIVKNTGTMYYWLGAWYSTKVNTQSGGDTTIFYIDENGLEDVTGIEAENPGKYISTALDTYKGMSNMMFIVSGNISDKDLVFEHKNSIIIIGDKVDSSVLNANIILNDSSFSIDNITVNDSIKTSNSCGAMSSTTTNKININNSNVVINGCKIKQEIISDNGATLTLKQVSADNSANIKADNGATINIINPIAGDNILYESLNFGKIYKDGSALSTSEQEAIMDLFMIQKIY